MNGFQKLATGVVFSAATMALGTAAQAATHLTIAFGNAKCVTGETSVYIGSNSYTIPTRDGKGTKEYLLEQTN